PRSSGIVTAALTSVRGEVAARATAGGRTLGGGPARSGDRPSARAGAVTALVRVLALCAPQLPADPPADRGRRGPRPGLGRSGPARPQAWPGQPAASRTFRSGAAAPGRPPPFIAPSLPLR